MGKAAERARLKLWQLTDQYVGHMLRMVSPSRVFFCRLPTTLALDIVGTETTVQPVGALHGGDPVAKVKAQRLWAFA